MSFIFQQVMLKCALLKPKTGSLIKFKRLKFSKLLFLSCLQLYYIIKWFLRLFISEYENDIFGLSCELICEKMQWIEDGSMHFRISIWWIKIPIEYEGAFHFVAKLCTKVCLSLPHSLVMAIDIERSCMVQRIQHILADAHHKNLFYQSIWSSSEHQDFVSLVLLTPCFYQH